MKHAIAALALLLSTPACADPTFGEALSRMGTALQDDDAPPAQQGGGFLKSQWVERTSRICVYDRMGSPYVITIDATSICPI